MAKQSDCKHERVDVHIQRAGLNRWTYHSCQQCGYEWTETSTVSDLADTVTSEEVIAVHEQLEADVTLKEIVE